MSRALRFVGCVVALLAAVNASSAAEKVRIGLLGMDNYQGVAYTHLFNNPAAEGDLAGVYVTAMLPVASDYPDSAALTARWLEQAKSYFQKPRKPDDVIPPQVIEVKSIDELFSHCDCVIMAGLDGRQHLEQATAALKAKKPVFIVRPCASSLADVIKIFAVAKETGTPCWSSSQHRFVPAFAGMRNHPEVGNVLGVDVYGGYEMTHRTAESDALIVPLHSIESMYAMFGTAGVETVSCTETPSTVSATLVWKDGRLGTYRGIREGKVKYCATVFGDAGVSTSGVYGHGVPVRGVTPTNDKYMGYEGIAYEIAKAFKTGKVPVQPEETIEVFAVCEAMKRSAAQNGAKVRIQDVLSEFRK